DAVPRAGNRLGNHADYRRCGPADGARTSSLQECNLRGLRRSGRPREVWQIEVAALCGRHRRSAERGTRARLCEARRGKRKAAQATSPQLPCRRKRQRVHRRFSPVGEEVGESELEQAGREQSQFWTMMTLRAIPTTLVALMACAPSVRAQSAEVFEKKVR